MNYLELYNKPEDHEWDINYEELYSNFIMYTHDIDEEIRNLEKILIFYKDILTRTKKIPTLEDLYDEVYSHNWEIVINFALSVYLKNPVGDMKVAIQEIEDEIFQWVKEDLDDAEIYIEDILEEQKMAYTYEEYAPFYEHNEITGVIAVINDCQVVLFPSVLGHYDFFNPDQRNVIFLEE